MCATSVTLLIIVALGIARFMKHGKFHFVNAVVDVINLIMNDNDNIKYQRLSTVELFIVVPLTFAGLIFVNGILCALQSYVTRPLKQPQIDTIGDIYKSSLMIAARDRNEAINVLTEQFEEDWTGRVNDDILNFMELSAFNLSQCYVTDTLEAVMYI